MCEFLQFLHFNVFHLHFYRVERLFHSLGQLAQHCDLQTLERFVVLSVQLRTLLNH